MRIAVLSAEPGEAELICEVLGAQGHACIRHPDRQSLSAHEDGFDLLLLDWQAAQEGPGLPASMRDGARPPVMLIAGRSADDDIVAAHQAGIDDVIVRPLRRAELALRVRALLRHAYPQLHSGQQQAFGAYRFDLQYSRIMHGERLLDVTQKEFELALLFFRHLDRPLSRAYIQEAIWPGHEDAGRSIDTHVSRVRTKLVLRPENGYRLTPVYSYGYRLQKLPE